MQDEIREFARRTRTRVDPGFSARIFEAIGIDRYVVTAASIGAVRIGWTAHGVSALRPAGDADRFERWYRERFARRIVPAVEEDPISIAARGALRGDGSRAPIDMRDHTPLERAVLAEVEGIEPQHARPVAWLAGRLQLDPRAVEATLQRCAVPLLIPLHRVVRDDYQTADFGLDVETNRRLLEAEGLDVTAVQRMIGRGFWYVGCADGAVCMPTCGDVATRTDLPGYTVFRSFSDACAGGFQACDHCRPDAA